MNATAKIGYFPGCSMEGSAREFGESLEAVVGRLGMELCEIPDWNCCGATAAHTLQHELSLALPARTLAAAERAGMAEFMVPCAACFSRMVAARHELLENESARKRISGIIEMDFKGSARPVNIIEFLAGVFSKGALEGKVVRPFGYTAACYYGCLLVRPPKITEFDRPEDPRIMDDIMSQIGAKTVEWAFKTECCGAGLSVTRTDVVARLCGRVLEDATKRGAQVMVVACPMCHSNLDMRREEIDKLAGKKYTMPVMYITQAIGMAMGIDEKTLGLHRHFTPVHLPEIRPAVAAGA